MKEELWLIWKESTSRRRYKIGILTKENSHYVFEYVNPELDDAIKDGFKYFPGFEDTDKKYTNDFLFTNIETRLPNTSRPDYLEILNSYNLNKDSNEFEILKATRGRSFTDTYEFVPPFEVSKLEFDVAGTNYSEDINDCRDLLKVNEKLFLELDEKNPYDENAVKVIYKNNGKEYQLGYVPRYYTKELSAELKKGTQYSAMIQSLNLDSKLSDENVTAKVRLIFDV